MSMLAVCPTEPFSSGFQFECNASIPGALLPRRRPARLPDPRNAGQQRPGCGARPAQRRGTSTRLGALISHQTRRRDNPAVKTFRLWLLILLAVVLPIRGAAAAAVLCPPMGSGGPQPLAVVEHHPAAAAQRAAGPHDHQQLQHHHGPGGHHDQHGSSGTPDAGKLCAAFCSATPLLSGLPTVAVPLQLSTVTFPALTAPRPSFVSGGQDRPPRTI